jgi:ornithine cyclodeaminase/alanine dehydrogenase-like protein (mu-crystallin family)
LLANPHSENLTVFGAGAQMEEHVNFLVTLFPSIRNCVIINRSQNLRLENMVNRLNSKFQGPSRFLRITALTLDKPDEVELAVKQSDVICCATSSTEPLFPGSWVKARTRLNLIGSYKPSMHEIDNALVRRAHRIVVDSSEACLLEAGELITAGLKEDDLIELGNICGIEQTHRDICDSLKRIDETQGKDVTIFKSVGVGAQDVMIATAVLQKAVELGIGNLIEQYD